MDLRDCFCPIVPLLRMKECELHRDCQGSECTQQRERCGQMGTLRTVPQEDQECQMLSLQFLSWKATVVPYDVLYLKFVLYGLGSIQR